MTQELITNVLRFFKGYHGDDFCSGNIQYKTRIIHFAVNDRYMTQFSVYEFASKAKEMAFNKGYFIESAYCLKGEFTSSYAILKNWDSEFIKKFNNITEEDAIFDACQYILNKEKEEKND